MATPSSLADFQASIAREFLHESLLNHFTSTINDRLKKFKFIAETPSLNHASKSDKHTKKTRIINMYIRRRLAASVHGYLEAIVDPEKNDAPKKDTK